MAYSTAADLNLSPERLIELTESEAMVGVVDTAVFNRLQLRANSRVDGALYGLWVTPVASPPGIIVDVEVAIWKYMLYQHREIMETPKRVVADYEWAVNQLTAWRAGEPLAIPAVDGKFALVGAVVV